MSITVVQALSRTGIERVPLARHRWLARDDSARSLIAVSKTRTGALEGVALLNQYKQEIVARAGRAMGSESASAEWNEIWFAMMADASLNAAVNIHCREDIDPEKVRWFASENNYQLSSFVRTDAGGNRTGAAFVFSNQIDFDAIVKEHGNE